MFLIFFIAEEGVVPTTNSPLARRDQHLGVPGAMRRRVVGVTRGPQGVPMGHKGLPGTSCHQAPPHRTP
eukprot:6419967-Pyramimonas_sp.AAC.1